MYPRLGGSMTSEQMTILIADDHPLFREALQQTISPLYTEAAFYSASDISQLQEVVAKHPQADLLLLDLHMPGAVGFSAVSWLVGQHQNIPIIMISADSQPNTVSCALDHGVAGFLSKSADVSVIHSSINAVLKGERGIHPGLEVANSGASLESLDVANALSSLTPQQFRVVSMLFDGLLNKQIAYQLDVKEATIKSHMTEIFRKLGVHSRTQAVLLLRNLTTLTPDEVL